MDGENGKEEGWTDREVNVEGLNETAGGRIKVWMLAHLAEQKDDSFSEVCAKCVLVRWSVRPLSLHYQSWRFQKRLKSFERIS